MFLHLEETILQLEDRFLQLEETILQLEEKILKLIGTSLKIKWGVTGFLAGFSDLLQTKRPRFATRPS
jgi:hypothetical protein